MNSRLVPQLARWVLEILVVSIIYYVAARLGLLLAFEHTNATPVWPPSGIAFAAVLVLGYRVWPGIFIGAFTANVVVFFANHTAEPSLILWISTFIASGNTLESITGAMLLHHLVGKDINPFNQSQDTFKFMVSAVAMCLVSAIIGPTKLCLNGIIPWSSYEMVWFTWLLGDLIGILVVTPFLLSWIRDFTFKWESNRVVEMVFLFLLLYLSCRIGFGLGINARGVFYPLAFLPIPFLIWSAFRFGHRVTTTAVLLVSGVAIWETVHGIGPFVRTTINESLLLLQIFVGVIAATILAMSAMIAERRTAEEQVRKFNESLEYKVNQRTAQLQMTLKELATEMTERKRIEDDADRFFKLSLDWLVISDFDQTIKRINPAFTKALGYSESEILNMKSLEVVHPDDREAAAREIKRLSAGNETILFECRVQTKDGSYRWSQWSAVPVLEQGIIFAMGRDVTEHKQAQEKLMASEEKMRLIIETANDAFIGMDAYGLITEWNRQAEVIFGWLRQEVIGKPLSPIIIPEAMREVHQQGFKHFLATGEGRILNKRIEIDALHRDGHLFPVELTVWPIRVGNIYRFNAFVHDITERKKSEEELFQKKTELMRINNEREQLKLFSMIVSHDLQSPLQRIISLTELMEIRNSAQLDDKGKDSLVRLKSAAVRMSELIESMLHFSRVAVNEAPFERLDLNQIMKDLLTDLEMRVKETGARIEIDKMPIIQGDKMQMRELFLNLITNAVKFHKKDESPRVTIKSRNLENGIVEITVSDNGIGFKEEDTERMFKPFERLHNQDEFEGHGMGLAICQRIVLHHGGKIIAKSAIVKGASFVITLPSISGSIEKAA